MLPKLIDKSIKHLMKTDLGREKELRWSISRRTEAVKDGDA